MAITLGGAQGLVNTFEKTLQGSALLAAHESAGLINLTNVVQPTSGNQYAIPHMSPIAFQDYDETAGNDVVQDPVFTQEVITATPTVARTQFGIFADWTSDLSLAANLGNELGMSYAEKVDQRVAAAFHGFKQTAGNTNYPVSTDGFARVKELGSFALAANGSILELVRKVRGAFKTARIAGAPVIVLPAEEHERLLAELTGGAVGGDLSAYGDELLRTGQIQNLYGASIVFSTFLKANAAGDLVGGAVAANAVTTVLKRNMEMKMGEVDGGLAMWLTGVAYIGAGVSDKRKGAAVIIER